MSNIILKVNGKTHTPDAEPTSPPSISIQAATRRLSSCRSQVEIWFQPAKFRLTSFFGILAGRRVRDYWRRSRGFVLTERVRRSSLVTEVAPADIGIEGALCCRSSA
jgi:hypothetical protein